MKVAVLQFPGSNCDQDALKALREDVGVEAEYVWHNDGSLGGFDAVLEPPPDHPRDGKNDHPHADGLQPISERVR